MTSRMTISGLVEAEETFAKKRFDLFKRSKIELAFDFQLSLFYDLLEEVEKFTSESPYDGGALVVNGGLVPSWEMKLPIHMFAGSFVQFTNAISHILRGQASEAYGHVRHAIENSGIAYMSKSESKIVEFYEAGNEFEMAKCLPTSRLLPRSNILTRDLNKMYKLASRHLHGNLHSNSLVSLRKIRLMRDPGCCRH